MKKDKTGKQFLDIQNADATRLAAMALARAHKGGGGKVMKTFAHHPSNTRVKTQTGC